MNSKKIVQVLWYCCLFQWTYADLLNDYSRYMATMLKFRHLQRCIIVPFTYIHTVQVDFPQVLILTFCVSVTAINILTWCAVTPEPINIFQGSYNTDLPPIRLSYHHGNHYNSVVDPHRQTVGAGLGFSSLRGVSFCFSKPLSCRMIMIVSNLVHI
jgi:hypothetical protein